MVHYNIYVIEIMMLILAVESSCDETAVAIYNEDKNRVYDVILSQANDHAQYGGWYLN